MARRLTAGPLPAWVGDLPVYQRVLRNGLKALVLPRPGVPTVVCDLFYPVGSADEPAGRSGLAHFVEHMLFKGTERLPKGQIDRLSFLAAGQSNAETAEDCTHYWFALPRHRWELALAIEADRMRHVRFDPLEVESERHVIAEERARELDSPTGRLDQTHLTVSYPVHPYRNPILGWPEDVRRVTAEDLDAFYRRHYRPDGAVLVIVGDVSAPVVLERIEEILEPVPRGELPRQAGPPPEPPQNERRAFELHEPEGLARGLLGWHTVPQGHPDGPALDVLSDLLCCGRRSRLWERLVESDRQAIWVDASQEAARLAGQFLIQVEAVRADPARLEETIASVLDELARNGPTEDELARSRRRLEAGWRWEQEELSGLALGLGSVALWGDWRAWQNEHRAALAVSAEDIQRVASSYLRESNLTVGWSLPRRAPMLAVVPAAPTSRPVLPPPPEGPLALTIPAGASILDGYHPRRTVLPSGMRLVSERRPGTGVVALDVFVEAGQRVEGRPGVAHLTARLREEGTQRRSAVEVAETIEDVGGTLEVHACGVSMRVRAEDLALAVELAAELLIQPAFPPADLPWLKRRIAAELAGDQEDPSYRAEAAFRRLVQGARHPLGRDHRGSRSQVVALSLEDIHEHHARFFHPENALMVVAGDFETRTLRRLVDRHFRSWRAGTLGTRPTAPPAPRLGKPRVERVLAAGEQVHVVIGHRGVSRLDPDFNALVLLDHILGCGPGFTDRLSRRIRDELGLAYSVGGGITDSADLDPGVFRIYLGTGPAEAPRAVAAVLEQIQAVSRGEFEDEEVERARRYLSGAWVFDFQTVCQRSERLLELERWGLPLDEPLRWPERIERITPRQVREAARRHLHPDHLIRVEYGPILPNHR